MDQTKKLISKIKLFNKLDIVTSFSSLSRKCCSDDKHPKLWLKGYEFEIYGRDESHVGLFIEKKHLSAAWNIGSIKLWGISVQENIPTISFPLLVIYIISILLLCFSLILPNLREQCKITFRNQWIPNLSQEKTMTDQLNYANKIQINSNSINY